MNYKKLETFVIDRLRRELPANLYYHGVGHTQNVLRDVMILAERQGVEGEKLILLKTAALLHDTGFLFQYRDNEPLGCSFAAEQLPAFGYSEAAITSIKQMILATALPQAPHDPLAELLCDADLFYLGTDRYWQIAEDYRRELAEHEIEFNDEQWLELQISFLSAHQYFTQAAKAMLDEQKRKHLNYLLTNKN